MVDSENLSEDTVTPEEALLIFQISRKTSDLVRTSLSILEELISEGYVIPDDKFQRIRKRLLDVKGGSDRELISLIKKLDISLKR